MGEVTERQKKLTFFGTVTKGVSTVNAGGPEEDVAVCRRYML